MPLQETCRSLAGVSYEPDRFEREIVAAVVICIQIDIGRNENLRDTCCLHGIVWIIIRSPLRSAGRTVTESSAAYVRRILTKVCESRSAIMPHVDLCGDRAAAGDLHVVDHLLHFFACNENPLHAHGHRRVRHDVEHIPFTEKIFRAHRIENRTRIDGTYRAEPDTRGNIRLDDAG